MNVELLGEFVQGLLEERNMYLFLDNESKMMFPSTVTIVDLLDRLMNLIDNYLDGRLTIYQLLDYLPQTLSDVESCRFLIRCEMAHIENEE
jgi:hypothetical protein